MVGIQRPIWGSKRSVDPTLTHLIFSLLSKAHHLQLYPLHLVNWLRRVNLPHLVNLHQLFNLPIVAKLFILDVHEPQLEEHLVCFMSSIFYIFIILFFLDPKPQTTQTADRNKFSPLNSPYAPYPIPAWSAALQSVDQSPSNLVEASKSMPNFGHYIFPDPGLFIHPATAGKYIESWLRVRHACGKGAISCSVKSVLAHVSSN